MADEINYAYDNTELDAQLKHATEQVAQDEALQQGITQAANDPGFLPDNPGQLLQETGAALAGGAADAVESVGGFLELSGDTLKTGLHHMFGEDIDDSQNPFHKDYVHGDGSWLDIPDDWVPENQSGLGKLARGLVEFGLLTAATGGVGGYPAGAAKVGIRLAAAGRAAGIGRKGVRAIKFLHKGAVIGAEGGIADLISSSSESANIANLVNEHAPWIPFSEALAIDPEQDNPWLARIKTVTAGGGVNLAGHALTGYIKGTWAAHKAKKAGSTVDEANAIGNKVMEDDIARAGQLDENAATEMAATNFAEGRGLSHALPRDEYLRQYLDEAEYARYVDPDTNLDDVAKLDEIANTRGAEVEDVWDDAVNQSSKQFDEGLGREADPFVNPNKFTDSERSTYRPDSEDPIRTNLKESIADMKAGGEGRSYSPLFTESALKRMSGNNAGLRAYILDAADEISQEAFKSLDNSLDFKEVQALIIKQADEIHGRVAEGGEAAVKELQNYFKNNNKDGIVWMHDGTEVVTGTASQKMALQLVINTLAKQVEAIAQGSKGLPTGVSLTRQVDQIYDAMKVAMTEHKKIGFMTGLELRYQKGDVLSADMKRQINQGLEKIDVEQNQFFDELKRLTKEGSWEQRRDLAELYELSGGKVRTLEDINRYLEANIKGGRMHGENITGRMRTELRSTFYNSILSSLKTPVKAIAGTNLIAMLRPFQAYLGAGLNGNKKEMLLAAAQIDAIGQAWAEGFHMFKHNWDLGVNRQSQTYVGKFDFERDISQWKDLKSFYERYGNANQQKAYNQLDAVVDFNNNPWVRYSQNAMGAGDALARTIIGRFEMRMRAARAALESGVDLDNVRGWADKYEESFRKDIFKKDQYGKWVVSDKATSLAGDEAAMTKALEGNLAGLENISRITGMRAFFPFVRTGFNALSLTFQHTELNRFAGKYQDIMLGENLTKYGIRPEDLPQAQALMRGRMAMGNTIIGMGTIAAATGLMTGSYPRDKETRDLWRLNGIQPNSFKFGDVYVSYNDIEPFNTLFTATANIINHSDVLGEDLRDDMLQKLVFMATAVIVDKSMLAGVEDLAQVISPTTGGGKLERAGAKFLRAHLPYSGLLAQVGNLMNANDVEANNMWETIWKRDAVAKSYLHPKYDILSKDRSGVPYIPPPGNPLLRLFNSISPVAVTYADSDPIKMALKEMSYNLPEVLSTYKGEKLSSYERSELQRYMSQGSLRRELELIMGKNSRWRSQLDEYKKLGLRQADGYDLYKQEFYIAVHKAFTRAKNTAMEQLQFDNPELAQRIEVRAAKSRVGKTSAYKTIPYLLNEFPR